MLRQATAFTLASRTGCRFVDGLKTTSNMTFLAHRSLSSKTSNSINSPSRIQSMTTKQINYWMLQNGWRSSSSSPSSLVWIQTNQGKLKSHQILAPFSSTLSSSCRSMSSQTQQDGNKQRPSGDGKETGDGGGGDDVDGKEIVLTPGQKVVAATQISMWAGVLVFACACAYYIGKELIPTKMSPNSVFNGATQVVRDDAQVRRQYGESLKFYGRDHGGHREGRRNFIEHTEYTDQEDGSKRTRVRFNMEGQFASAFCFAEVSKDMPSGEFVYILVQDKQTGRVIAVVDNRAALTAQRLAGGNKESSEAMKQLLSGGGKSS